MGTAICGYLERGDKVYIKMALIQSPLRLIFIRPNSTNDDVLSVVSTGTHGSFQCSYTDKLSNLRNDFVATESELLDYIDSMFVLLTNDEEPFESVQLSSPVFPSVLLSPATLSRQDIQTEVYNIIRSTLRNWPTRQLYPVAQRPERPLVVSLSDESSEEEEDGEIPHYQSRRSSTA